MTRKINGIAKWTIVILALLTVAFNTGVTYNHIHNLTERIGKLTATVEKMDAMIIEIRIKLAENESELKYKGD